MTFLSDADLIKIAEAAISGKAKRQRGAPVEVTRAGGRATVTFVHQVPPGTLGADYDAQVIVDASSGQVVQVKLGS